MRNLCFSLLCASAIALPLATSAKDSNVVLKLDGRPYSINDIEREVRLSMPLDKPSDFTLDENDDEMRRNVARTIVQRHVLRKALEESGIDKDPEMLERLNIMKERFLVEAFLNKKVPTLVSDSDVKAKYDEAIKALGDKKEVHARHILVETEEEAKKISEKLKKNPADFEKLANENSKDPGSKTQGGDLGYFTYDQMVPEFSKVAFELEKGAISDPVKSDFGWHIIKSEDKRKLEIPPLKDLEPQLRASLEQEAFYNYVKGLITATDVEYYNHEGKVLPLYDDIKAEAPAKAVTKAKEE